MRRGLRPTPLVSSCTGSRLTGWLLTALDLLLGLPAHSWRMPGQPHDRQHGSQLLVRRQLRHHVSSGLHQVGSRSVGLNPARPFASLFVGSSACFRPALTCPAPSQAVHSGQPRRHRPGLQPQRLHRGGFGPEPGLHRQLGIQLWHYLFSRLSSDRQPSVRVLSLLLLFC